MQSASFKHTLVRHLFILCIGPIVVLVASLFGADYFDDFAHETTGFTAVFKFGMLLLITLPIFVILRGIWLAVRNGKQDKRWLALPLSTLIFSILIFPLAIVLNFQLSTFSDCNLRHEDNQAKCGY